MVRRFVVKGKTLSLILAALALVLCLAVTAWGVPGQAPGEEEGESSEGEETPPPPEEETPEPPEETPAPAVEETPAPAEETPVPAEETPEAVEETPVPAEETPEAIEETPAAAEEPAQPEPETEAPEAEESVPLLEQMKGLDEISGGETKTGDAVSGEAVSGEEVAPPSIPESAEAPVGEETEAAPPIGEGTEAIAEPQIEIQRLTPEEMAAFQERLGDLREQIMTSKARLMQLREQLMLGSVSIIALSIVHQHEVGGTFKLETLSYILDGFEIYAGVNSPENNLDKLEEFPVYEGSLLPGDHLLVVDMIFRGRGYGIFSYLNQYLFKVKARYLFTVNEGDVVTLNVISYDEGSFLTSLKDRLKVRFEMK